MNINCKHCGKLLFVKEPGQWGDPRTYLLLGYENGIPVAECNPTCKVPAPTITITPPKQ